ncbi:putative protein suppressor of silencing [Erwinia phage pEa_SNUABM_57]|uniref:HNS binding protein n=1 Tax=Erwinia phage pEa_SNUABM_57 TaxID=2996118 RepID=A0A9E8YU85_9CAUD|nr:putative protein suppressor of silencing [Erwinia phage pEa_SNUABM_57]
MAITQKFKVSFDVKHIIDSETEAQMDELVMETARFLSGKTDKNHWPSRAFAEEVMVQALNGGKEAVAAFLVKHGIREYLRTELREDGFKFSPAVVREVK